MSACYYLNENVFACMAGETHLMLDAQADRYLWLTDKQSSWLSEVAGTDTRRAISGNARQFADTLVEKGLLTADASVGRPISQPELPAPRVSIFGQADDSRTRPRWRYAPRMATALLRCSHLRTSRSNLAHCISTIGKWRARTKPDKPARLADVLKLAGQFHALSPYFFTTHDACYFRSLVLIRFLAGFGIDADWVFGVRLAPFGAHCWVSWKDALLNEALDTVAEYQPIMIIQGRESCVPSSQ